MTSVATLICHPARPVLDDALLARVAGALPQAGAPVWLAPGIAADISFNGTPPAGKPGLDGLPVDFAVQPAAGRRKKLLVADMDSTMIGQECIDELADMVGLKSHVAAITERAMRGEIAFEPALRERVALLKGLPVAVIEQVIRERITLMSGARALIGTMRAQGAHTCLVSGGFTLFTQRVAEMIGFDENHANELLVEGDKLAGAVREPVLGREAKRATLAELTRRLGLAAADTMAVGDGANDLDMIAEAGLGVAYHAKPKVADAAQARIDHGDLTALLYLQGYSRSEFAAG